MFDDRPDGTVLAAIVFFTKSQIDMTGKRCGATERTDGDAGAKAELAAPETVSGFLISLLFWLSLLAAAGLFAAVGLSPKLLEQAGLREACDANQFRLVQIERQNEQLQRVVKALRMDRDFAAELTRIEFDAIGPGEEIIPVSSELRLSPPNQAYSSSPALMPRAWYQHLVLPFAKNESLRRSMLGTAAALVILSFTWFQPSSARRLDRPVGACRSVWQTFRARYVRS